jgi:hypothetical protein
VVAGGATLGGEAFAGAGDALAAAAGRRSSTERELGCVFESVRLVIMKTAPRIVVARERTFAEPRGPNAVWVPPPPNALARSWPLPCWSKTTQIKKIQQQMCRASTA